MSSRSTSRERTTIDYKSDLRIEVRRQGIQFKPKMSAVHIPPFSPPPLSERFSSRFRSLNSRVQLDSCLFGSRRTRLPYIQFLGAAGTVTGSKHLINTTYDSSGKRGFQALIDCGLFQGPKEWRERNWQDTPVPAREIDAVILTHAHLDHCGWIPRLVKEGFHGPIYATPPTIDLCSVVLPDSGHLQEEDAAFHNKKGTSKHSPALPLYTLEEAQDCLQYFKAVEVEGPSSSARSFPSALCAPRTSWVRAWQK